MTKHLFPAPITPPIIYVVKPDTPDTLNSQGGHVSGFREVYFHKKKRDGYIVVNDQFYGCEELAMFVGNYVWVEAADFWCSNVYIGGEPSHQDTLFNTYKCRRI